MSAARWLRGEAFSAGRTYAGSTRPGGWGHLEHVSLTTPLTDLLDLPALAEVLDTVPDPRSRRGLRYRLGPLLALSLLAVLGGATSLAKITRVIAGYGPHLRVRAGLPATVKLAASTLGRLLSRLNGDAFDTATCGYLA